MPDDSSQHEVTDEELVAYLDGELADGESAAVESRLAADPELRNRVAQFAQTWDALEILKHDVVSDGFTQKTLEEVSIDLRGVEGGGGSKKASVSSAREWRLAGVCFLAGVIGSAMGVGRPSALSKLTPEEWEVIHEMARSKNGPSVELLKSIIQEERNSDE